MIIELDQSKSMSIEVGDVLISNEGNAYMVIDLKEKEPYFRYQILDLNTGLLINGFNKLETLNNEMAVNSLDSETIIRIVKNQNVKLTEI